MSDGQDGSRANQAGTAGAIAAVGSSARDSRVIEEMAGALHMLSRRRAHDFNAAVMADSAMDLILSMLVARLQGRDLSVRALAGANLLRADQCEALLVRMAQAGLCEAIKPDRPARLTERGARHLRDYLDRITCLAA